MPPKSKVGLEGINSIYASERQREGTHTQKPPDLDGGHALIPASRHDAPSSLILSFFNPSGRSESQAETHLGHRNKFLVL